MAFTSQCPNCHSMNVWSKGVIGTNMEEIEFIFTCRKCEHEWKDTFELGPHIRTSVIQQGNKSRKHRVKFDVTKPGVTPPEADHLYQVYRKILNLPRNNKYRKKPVVVEAVQWDGTNVEEISTFTDGKVAWYYNKRCMYITTPEGRMEVSIDDWIIRGVNGEYYPCKPDVFAKNYEPVSED